MSAKQSARLTAVSYTHLDVYKRQLFRRTLKGFDIALGNLNVGNARVLLHKLL